MATVQITPTENYPTQAYVCDKLAKPVQSGVAKLHTPFYLEIGRAVYFFERMFQQGVSSVGALISCVLYVYIPLRYDTVLENK